jgi:hypothetical protein
MSRSTFAVYRGDEFVDVGTAEEIAKRLGCKPDTIRFYASPSYKARLKDGNNRLVAVRIDEEDET